MYTEQELKQLIDDVEKEFNTTLVKAESNFRTASLSKSTPGVEGSATLAKAEDAKPPEAKDKEKKEPKSEEEPSEEAPEAQAAEEAEAEGEAEAEVAAEDAAPEAPGSEDAHGYDEEDLAHLEQMYGSMSRAELMAHHDAVKVCLDAMGMEDAAPEAAMDEAPEAMAPEAAAHAAPMQKSETANVSAEVALLKSELDASKAKSEELKKNFDAVSEFVTKLMTKKVAPAGKAITNAGSLAKSESTAEEKTLSKSEVNSILIKKTAEPSLKKSDRDLINAYYLNGASINTISHLLKSGV